MKKKLLSLFLITVALISLTACKKTAEGTNSDQLSSNTPASSEAQSEISPGQEDMNDEAAGFTDWIEYSEDLHDIFATYEWRLGDATLTRDNTIEDLIAVLEEQYDGDVSYSGYISAPSDNYEDLVQYYDFANNPTFSHKVIIYTGDIIEDVGYKIENGKVVEPAVRTFDELIPRGESGHGRYTYVESDGCETYGELPWTIDSLKSVDIQIASENGEYPNSTYTDYFGDPRFNGSYGSRVYFEPDTHKLVFIEGYEETRHLVTFRKVEDGPMLYDQYPTYTNSGYTFIDHKVLEEDPEAYRVTEEMITELTEKLQNQNKERREQNN